MSIWVCACAYKQMKGGNKDGPGVTLEWLDELSRCIIVGDVEPEAMRDGSGNTFSQAERVATDKVSTFSIRVIQGVEEEGC